MSLAVPQPGLLRSSLRDLVERRPEADAVGFRCAGWDGPPALEVAGRRCRIHWCPSALAVRDVLSRGVGEESLLVILTDRGDDELGLDATARLLRRRLLEIDPWLALRQAFGAKTLDSRLGEESWLADDLLAALPAGGYPPVTAGTLDLDRAWTAFLEHRLALPGGAVDLPSLLRWSEMREGPQQLRALGDDQAQRVLDHLRRRGGVANSAVGHLACGDHESDAIALGLVCRVLYAEGGDGSKAQVAGAARLEERLDGETLPAAEGLRWAVAAEALMVRHQESEPSSLAVRQILRRADQLLERLKVTDQAHLSAWLPSGYRRRLERFAAALERAMKTTPLAFDDELQILSAEVLRHQEARGASGTVGMALRLARWLAREEAEASAPGSFSEAAAHYASDLALADLARGTLWGGDGGASLAAVSRALLDRVLTARERFNRRFGELARGWIEAEGAAPAVVPVEQVLQRIVGPLAGQVPVLLLVLDGLSFAVYHQLLGDLLDRGWEPWLADDLDQPAVAVTALPGVTKVSRTSLFTGDLRKGSQSTERQGFAAHPDLLAASAPNLPPVLFHKAELRGEGGLLADDVRRELARKNRRVVGVVHNAVDDHLTKGDQISPAWSVTVLRHLEALLDAAAEAGRVVVMTADHGHLPEHSTELEGGDGRGERYRPAAGDPNDGEIVVRGRRVLSEDGALIVPWSETVRYRRRKAGYHGGLSPQELLVPLTVFVQGSVDLPGWHPQAGALPDWWEPRRQVAEAESVKVLRPARRKARRPPEAQRTLFDERAPETREVDPIDPAINDPWAPLFDSPMWQAQTARTGSPGLVRVDRVRSVLDLLASHGGRISLEAACRALHLGLPRLRSTVTQLQRLLNVDAYPILDLDEAAGELRLAHDLLAEQFELPRR